MTNRKTLALKPEAACADAPALKKKGRGWEISDKRLDALHQQARELRRHSSEAHKALAEKFAAADMGRYTFKRHAVVGSAIVDFNCHNLGLALAIDEEGQNDRLARRRDKSLESVGIKVMRIAAKDILTDIDGVLERLTRAMRERIAAKKEAARAHKAAHPKQTYSRPKPRGANDTAKPRSRQP
ncbi:MAG: endonuclease domain-containing protein [Erythrobacter sp.]